MKNIALPIMLLLAATAVNSANDAFLRGSEDRPEEVSFYFFRGDTCGDFKLYPGFVAYAKRLYQEGNCTNQGFTLVDGSKVGDLHNLGAVGRATRVFYYKKAEMETHCTQCLIHNCCSDGLKCITDGHDGACTTCTGQYETVCGDKCCKGGQECNGDSCTLPLFQTA